MIGIICKGTGIVIFIINLLTGIFSGEFMVFLLNAIAGFIVCILFYAMGEIVDLLSVISDRTYQLHCDFKEHFGDKEEKIPSVPSASNPHDAPSALNKDMDADGTWVCLDCGSKNQNNSRFCSSCGKYR